MAFSVTPTSGAAPYTYEASFLYPHLITSGAYELRFQSLTATGSCPSDFSGVANNPGRAASLLMSGEYVLTTSIPAGVCSSARLSIQETSSGVVVSEMFVSINNVA